MMGRAFTGCVYSLGAFFLFSVGDLALKILGGHYNPFVSALVMLFGVHKNRELVEPDPNGPAKEER